MHGTFILGLPGETRETIEETIRFAREVNPHTIQVSVAAPYPGTELHRQAVANGWLPDDDDGATLVSERGTQLAALSYPHLGHTEILDSVDAFYRRFYFRAGKLAEVPGAVTPVGPGRPPRMLHSLDDPLPARHLGGRRRKYFIGVMDPAASIEFTRGSPWDCSFCSAWTFYGRSYRRLSPEAAAEDMARIREPGVFIVDDVAFIKAEDGEEIARQLEHRSIRKQYYLETRCDVLLRNEEVFRRWRRLGLNYMFLGLEALDADGLKAFRKRTTPKVNNKALEVARSIGLSVAINIIADPDWDEARFAFVREWAMSVPEIVNITVQTPYPGTETCVSACSATANRPGGSSQRAPVPARVQRAAGDAIPGTLR